MQVGFLGIVSFLRNHLQSWMILVCQVFLFFSQQNTMGNKHCFMQFSYFCPALFLSDSQSKFFSVIITDHIINACQNHKNFDSINRKTAGILLPSDIFLHDLRESRTMSTRIKALHRYYLQLFLPSISVHPRFRADAF